MPGMSGVERGAAFLTFRTERKMGKMTVQVTPQETLSSGAGGYMSGTLTAT